MFVDEGATDQGAQPAGRGRRPIPENDHALTVGRAAPVADGTNGRTAQVVRFRQTWVGMVPAMRVGEVARRTGLSVRMVRYYEERRYLPQRPRTPGRHRHYDEIDVRWLEAMTTLRAAGVGPALATRALRGQLNPAELDRVQQRLTGVLLRVHDTQDLLRPAASGPAPTERRISLGFDIFLLRERMETLLSAALRRTGITSGEYAVLSVVFYESLTPAALTRLVGVAPSTLTRRLQMLLERGWIARRPNPARASSWVLELTEDGRDQIRRCVPIADEILDRLDTELRRAGLDPAGFRRQVQLASSAVRSMLHDQSPRTGRLVSSVRD